MIKDLVMHFLRQGVYAKSGDIIVLCAYLGQLIKIRDALSKEVTTVIDERDAVQLIDHEEQSADDHDSTMMPGATAEKVQVSQRV